MGRLTGGHIRISERRKIGDYEHRECEIILAFSFEDSKDAGGFEAYMDQLQGEIRARVQAEASGKPLPMAIAHQPGTADDAPVSAPKRRGRPPRAAEKDPAPMEDEDGPVADETADDDPDTDDDPGTEVGIDDLLEETKPKGKEIPNAKLHEEVKATNLRVKNAKVLRAYIEEYAESVNAIPQEKRADFLKGLKSLKAPK